MSKIIHPDDAAWYFFQRCPDIKMGQQPAGQLPWLHISSAPRPERAARFSVGRSPTKHPAKILSPERAARIMRTPLQGLILTYFVEGLRPSLKRAALSGRKNFIHTHSIFSEGELDENTVVRNFRTTAANGKKHNTGFYSLDAIIFVGYRVKSLHGTQLHLLRAPTPLLASIDEKSNVYFLHIANSGKSGCKKAQTEYEKYKTKTQEDLSPAERDYLASIKAVQKKMEGKNRKKKDGDTI